MRKSHVGFEAWQKSLFNMFGDSLNNVQEARLRLGAIFLALTTADASILEELGVTVEGTPKRLPKAAVLAHLQRLYPSAKDVLGYALTGGTLRRLGEAYVGMKDGASHGGWSVGLDDLTVLALTPSEIAELVERLRSGDIRIKDVVKQVNRVKSDAANLAAAQKVIRAKLAEVTEAEASASPEQSRQANIERLVKEIASLESKLIAKRAELQALVDAAPASEGATKIEDLISSLLLPDEQQPSMSA